MSSGKIADAVIGIGLALVAGYLFVVLVGVVNATLERRWPTADLLDLFIGGPIFVLAFTFWLVLPSGAILGAWIPAIVKNKPGATAVLYGVIFGFVIGLVFAAVAAYVMADVATISSDGSTGCGEMVVDLLERTDALRTVYDSLLMHVYWLVRVPSFQ